LEGPGLLEGCSAPVMLVTTTIAIMSASIATMTKSQLFWGTSGDRFPISVETGRIPVRRARSVPDQIERVVRDVHHDLGFG
jgi:hypothetical protein